MKTTLIVFSGGQDSTLSIFWALRNLEPDRSKIILLSFDYGQRHKAELSSARKIALYLHLEHTLLPVNTFTAIGDSALVNPSEAISQKPGELPTSFVPGRNLIFLTFAAAFARKMGINRIVTGVSEEDFSGYPDCRATTICSLQDTIQYGMDWPEFIIHTPMMFLPKASALEELAKGDREALEALSLSHTCYEGKRPPCGVCPSCLLREKSFQSAGFPDPLKFSSENI